MSRFKYHLFFAACLLGGGISTTARGQGDPIWTHTASACAIVPAAQSPLNTLAQGADLTYPPLVGTTSKIIAICNVHNPLDTGANPNWGCMEIGYKDPDGSATANEVQVSLRRLPNIPSSGPGLLVTELSSNTNPSTIRTNHQALFSHTFDFRSNVYYVQLTLRRTGTAQAPLVSWVRLQSKERCGGGPQPK